MSLELRVLLVIVSLAVLVFVARKIRDSKIKLEDSIFWICFAALVFVLSLFPQVFFLLADLAGTQAPVNFVFLFFIFVLLIKTFSLNLRISQADVKIKELVQQLAIEKYERRQNDEWRSSASADYANSN